MKAIFCMFVSFLFCLTTAHSKTIKYPNGDIYEGECKKGQPNGQGTMRYASSGLTYVGMWIEGKRSGHGKLINTHENSAGWVDCFWKDGKRIDTNDKISYCPGQDIYDGEWENDQFNGNGIYFPFKELYKIFTPFDVDNCPLYYTTSFRGIFKDGKFQEGQITGENIIKDIIVKDGKWESGSIKVRGLKIGDVEIKYSPNEKYMMVDHDGDTTIVINDSIIGSQGTYRMKGITHPGDTQFMHYIIRKKTDGSYVCALRLRYPADPDIITTFPLQYTKEIITQKDGISQAIDDAYNEKIKDPKEKFLLAIVMLDKCNEWHDYGLLTFDDCALNYLEQADQQGNKEATLRLGDYYYYCSSSNVDSNEEAYKYYKKLADDGDAYGTYRTYCCIAGRNGYAGAIKNLSYKELEALKSKWLNLAIQRGSQDAVKEKARLKQQAIKDDAAYQKAQKEARRYSEWEKKHPVYREGCTICRGTGISLIHLSEKCAFCQGRGYIIKRK